MSHSVNFKGNPVTLAGQPLKVGDSAPDFKLQGIDLADVTLANAGNKAVILVVVPSLDTAVCSLESKKFNDAVAQLSNAEVWCISMDLPFAMKRWCAAENAANIKVLSAHRSDDFGQHYATLITGGPLERCLARAVFVVQGGKVKYVEYVPEIAQEPNYDGALNAAKS